MDARATRRHRSWRWLLCSAAFTTSVVTGLGWVRSSDDFDAIDQALGYAVTSTIVYAIMAALPIVFLSTIVAAASALWRPGPFWSRWLIAVAICSPPLVTMTAFLVGPVG